MDRKQKDLEFAKMMDMMTRMQYIERIDEALKEMTKGYKELDFRTMDLEQLKNISDAFEDVVIAMKGTDEDYQEKIPKTCRNCDYFGSHHGICDICKDYSRWTPKGGWNDQFEERKEYSKRQV